MIKMLLTWPSTGRQVLLLGLSGRNVDLLRDKKPIHINAEDLGLSVIPPVHEVFVVYGKTEDEIEAELREKGWLTDDDRIITIPKAPIM